MAYISLNWNPTEKPKPRKLSKTNAFIMQNKEEAYCLFFYGINPVFAGHLANWQSLYQKLVLFLIYQARYKLGVWLV